MGLNAQRRVAFPRAVRRPCLWFAACWVILGCLAVPAQENSLCLDCHHDPASDMEFDVPAFSASVHGDLSCIDCHDDLEGMTEDHDAVRRVDCSGCHEDEAAAYAASEHGRAATNGVREAAGCADCHGPPHAMMPAGNTNAPTHFTHIPDTCGRCHAKAEVMARYQPRKQQAVVDYSNSVHGVALRREGKHAAVCTDCHGTHGIQRGTQASSPMHWQRIPATCGACHEKVAAAFASSVHGRAVAAGQRDAPVCTDCHGEHSIAAIKDEASSVSPAHIPETCGQCHASQRIATRYTLPSGVLDTYMQSFHGLASQIGGVAAANCASCHGVHDILPSSDPASSIHRDNLPRTCGKCHQGIGTRLAQGDLRIHEPPGAAPGKRAVVNAVATSYIGVIVAVIGGMLVFNLLDLGAKVRAHVRRVKADPRSESRLTPWLRAQHALLVLTFVALAYTGFVHKYPNGWWAWPLQVIENGSYWRGLLHRVAGWLFTGLFAFHLAALFGTRRGRAYLEHLRPGSHDFADTLLCLRRNVGLTRQPLPHRRFNFAEKAEYWALVWGSVVMIVTGIMLIFSSIVMRMLPQVWLEVAQVVHYYEAVLATLAIVVWHFYWVIFDPNEYPTNPAWLIGKKSSGHGAEPPAEDT